jgi:hypothetical protein
MPKQPKDHVKKHLDKNHVDPATLPDSVIDALNAFEPDELDKVDDLGAALMASQVPNKIAVVH